MTFHDKVTYISVSQNILTLQNNHLFNKYLPTPNVYSGTVLGTEDRIMTEQTK